MSEDTASVLLLLALLLLLLLASWLLRSRSCLRVRNWLHSFSTSAIRRELRASREAWRW